MRTITKLFLSSMLLVNGTMALAHSDGGFVDKDFFKGMKKDDKAAILMVQFWYYFQNDTRALTIDRINEKVKKEFKNVDVKEAYTSRIIMRRLKERGIVKLNPQEVLDELKSTRLYSCISSRYKYNEWSRE